MSGHKTSSSKSSSKQKRNNRNSETSNASNSNSTQSSSSSSTSNGSKKSKLDSKNGSENSNKFNKSSQSQSTSKYKSSSHKTDTHNYNLNFPQLPTTRPRTPNGTPMKFIDWCKHQNIDLHQLRKMSLQRVHFNDRNLAWDGFQVPSVFGDEKLPPLTPSPKRPEQESPSFICAKLAPNRTNIGPGPYSKLDKEIKAADKLLEMMEKDFRARENYHATHGIPITPQEDVSNKISRRHQNDYEDSENLNASFTMEFVHLCEDEIVKKDGPISQYYFNDDLDDGNRSDESKTTEELEFSTPKSIKSRHFSSSSSRSDDNNLAATKRTLFSSNVDADFEESDDELLSQLNLEALNSSASTSSLAQKFNTCSTGSLATGEGFDSDGDDDFFTQISEEINL